MPRSLRFTKRFTKTINDQIHRARPKSRNRMLQSVCFVGLAILLSAATSAQVNGVLQGNLDFSGNQWAYGMSFHDDYSAPGQPNREWYSCGNSTGGLHPYICYASGGFFVNTDIYGPNYGLCDIADPSAVKFNGLWYMYVTAIKQGNSGCSTGTNGNIYAFSSSDARTWTILNSGNPVISIPDSGGFGIGQPSAVVMGYNYTCTSGTWHANPTTPFIRLYYTWNSNPPNPGYSLYASDSSNGVTFVGHRTNGLGNPPSPIFINGGTGIKTGGWYPSVKKLQQFGDYPLVMAYASGPTYTAVTGRAPSDFTWTGGNSGNSVPFNPNPTQAQGKIEGNQEGKLLDIHGSGFTGLPTGQINFWWPSGGTKNVRYLYLGQGNTSTYFPWVTAGGSCP